MKKFIGYITELQSNPAWSHIDYFTTRETWGNVQALTIFDLSLKVYVRIIFKNVFLCLRVIHLLYPFIDLETTPFYYPYGGINIPKFFSKTSNYVVDDKEYPMQDDIKAIVTNTKFEPISLRDLALEMFI